MDQDDFSYKVRIGKLDPIVIHNFSSWEQFWMKRSVYYQKKKEAEAWSEIKTIVQTAIQQYPTTLQEDIIILQKDIKENKLGQNKRNCIKYRKNEKIMLHFLLKCAEKVDELLQMT